MKSIKFMKTNLTPPKIPIWSKFLAWDLCWKSYISLSISWIPANEDSKFKLDCVESENSYILLIDAVNFQSRLTLYIIVFKSQLVISARY